MILVVGFGVPSATPLKYQTGALCACFFCALPVEVPASPAQTRTVSGLVCVQVLIHQGQGFEHVQRFAQSCRQIAGP